MIYQRFRNRAVSLTLATLVLCGFVPTTLVTAQENGNTLAADTAATSSLESPVTSTDPAALGYTVESFPGSSEVIGDFVVGPGKVELSLKPGESKKVEITATNRTGVDRIFKFSAEDTMGTKSGQDAIVLLGTDRGPYSLKDYLDIPTGGILIKQGQRVRIPVTVAIPADASPGGLYGSALVETLTLPAETDSTVAAAAKSPLITRIGTLFFVTVEGALSRDAELVDFSTPGNKTLYSGGPIVMNVLHENRGNVHVVPYGEVEIFNYAGDSVQFIELDPWFVMPESLRNRELTWDRQWLLGRYTAVARINRGYDNIVDEREFQFWVIPWKVVAGTFGVLFLFFFIIRFFTTRFEFKRKS